MGGIIAVTIRYSNDEEWRGSMWTNVLPEGIFAPDFYSAAKSESHVRQFIVKLEKNRAENPDIDELWGHHGKLAPVEYGIVVIDFKTKHVISHQGYCSVTKRWWSTNNADPVKQSAYHAVGATTKDDKRDWGWMHRFRVKSFWRVNESFEVTAATRRAIKALGFKLTPAENRCWLAYLKRKLA